MATLVAHFLLLSLVCMAIALYYPPLPTVGDSGRRGACCTVHPSSPPRRGLTRWGSYIDNLTVRQATYMATAHSCQYCADHHQVFDHNALTTPAPPTFRSSLTSIPQMLWWLWRRIPGKRSFGASLLVSVKPFHNVGNSHLRCMDMGSSSLF
jgi:hypothetical protein